MNKKQTPRDVISTLHKSLTQLRHTIHRHPDLSGGESETAKRVLDFMKKFEPDKITTGIGGNGLLFTFGNSTDGPHIMVRSELDALPIHEHNDMSYVSEKDKVSHKCGHDGHMAILCGVGGLLHHLPPSSGKVTLLFQPAEETGQGAQWMLDDNKFDIKPDYAFALHNIPGFEKHRILIRNGIFASASSGFHVRLQGETSHASHPEEGSNPALAMTSIIDELLAMPQIHTEFDDPALMTIIFATLGARGAYGTSAGNAEVMATLRTHQNRTMNDLKKRAEALAKGIGKLHKLEVSTEWVQEFHATVNDRNCIEQIKDAAEYLNLDAEEMPKPFPWSEDFGRFTSAFQGAMFGLGSGKDQPRLHNSTYDFPDEIIPTGSLMFYRIIAQILNKDL